MKGKGYTTLTVPQARQLLMEDRRAVLVDTRSAGEYRRGTLPGSVSIPRQRSTVGRRWFCGTRRHRCWYFAARGHTAGVRLNGW